MPGVKGMQGPNKGKGTGYAWLVARLNQPDGECLIWPFYRSPQGRGMVSYNGERWYAARLMCQLVHGEPPTPEHQAAHSCGNGHGGCVHPGHLSWKTQSENSLDCRQHGTSSRHNSGSGGKLTFEQAEAIRALKGIETAFVVAGRYGVHFNTIYMIWGGHTFKAPDQQRIKPWSPEEDHRLRLAITRGMNKHDTAKLVGRGVDGVWRRARQLGIYVPPIKRGLPPGHVR